MRSMSSSQKGGVGRWRVLTQLDMYCKIQKGLETYGRSQACVQSRRIFMRASSEIVGAMVLRTYNFWRSGTAVAAAIVLALL